MPAQVGSQCTHGSDGHVVDMHDGAELDRLGAVRCQTLVIQDQDWPQHHGRYAGTGCPRPAHLLGKPFGHPVGTCSTHRVIIIDRKIRWGALAFGAAEDLSRREVHDAG